MTDFPYPGDDPASLASAASTFDANVSNMQTLISGMATAESNIHDNWDGATATAAAGDVSKINDALHLTTKDFTTSKTALETLRSVLVPIRSQIDDLRRQLSSAQTTLQGEQEQYGRAARFGEANDMTPDEIQTYRNGIAANERTTEATITGLNNQYDALVKKANTATTACSDALKATISGQTYDPNISGLKSEGLDDLLGLGGMKLLHRWQAGLDAAKAAADAKKLIGMDPQSPEAVKLANDLRSLLDKYPGGDPDFSVPFLKSVGQEGLLKLTVEVAGLTTYDEDTKGLVETIGAIQRDLGTDLAAATHLLGKPNPDGIQQLDQSWVDELLKDGGKSYQTHLGGYYYGIKGFQSLGVLLRTGDYGSTFLSESGDAMMDFEKKYDSDGGLRSNVWLDDMGDPQFVRLWYGAGDGDKTERGMDPFNGWLAAMQNSSEGRQVLYDDVTSGAHPYNNHGLLNYLLNDRDWSLRDTKADTIFAHYQEGETLPGLIDLGSMLDHTVQGTGRDPQSQAIFASMVHDLGDSHLNHNIGSGKFGGDDWINPELRPFLGDIVAKNIDLAHNSLAGEAGNGGIDELDMKRVLMDLGKDHGQGGAADTIKGAEAGYVKDLVAEKIKNGDETYKSDGTGMAKLFAGLDFGKNASIAQAQADADEAHNGMVDEIVDDFSSVVGFGADKAVDEIPGGSLVTGWLIDHAADAIKDSLHHDGSALVQAQGDDASDVSRKTFDSVLRQAAIASVVPRQELIDDGLIGSDGNMVKIDDAELGTDGWKKVSEWMKSHGYSDELNLATSSNTAYSASYSEDAAHYLSSP